jgi:hypothetical protein
MTIMSKARWNKSRYYRHPSGPLTAAKVGKGPHFS